MGRQDHRSSSPTHSNQDLVIDNNVKEVGVCCPKLIDRAFAIILEEYQDPEWNKVNGTDVIVLHYFE